MSPTQLATTALALVALTGLARPAASPAKAGGLTATVLAVDRPHHTARLVWHGESHRVRYRGSLSRSVRFGSRVRVSGRSERRRIALIGPAKQLRVRGRVERAGGRRVLRLADRGVLPGGGSRRARSATAGAADRIAVSLEGFPVGFALEVVVRFAADRSTSITIRPLTCCTVPEHPRIGDRMTLVGEFDLESLWGSEGDADTDHVLVVSTKDAFDSMRRTDWLLPYPAAFRMLQRRLLQGDLVRVEGHLARYDARIHPDDWAGDPSVEDGIWVADRVVALDPSVASRPERPLDDEE